MADRSGDLLADYEVLGRKLLDAEGSAAAALVRERRALRVLLAEAEVTEEDAVVDKLAGNVTRLDTNRRGRPGSSGAAASRGKSG